MEDEAVDTRGWVKRGHTGIKELGAWIRKEATRQGLSTSLSRVYLCNTTTILGSALH